MKQQYKTKCTFEKDLNLIPSCPAVNWSRIIKKSNVSPLIQSTSPDGSYKMPYTCFYLWICFESEDRYHNLLTCISLQSFFASFQLPLIFTYSECTTKETWEKSWMLLHTWERNRGSLDQNSRISGISKRTMASLSSPRPNAHETVPALPLFSKIADSVTPQPRTSSQSPWLGSLRE